MAEEDVRLPVAIALDDQEQVDDMDENLMAVVQVIHDEQQRAATSFLFGMLQDNITCTSVLGWGEQACNHIVKRCNDFPDDVFYRDSRTGRSPLHEAALRCRCLHIISAILAVNPSRATSVDHFGNTPIHLFFKNVATHALAESEMSSLIDALSENASEVASMPNRKGNTILHLACEAPETMIHVDCFEKILNANPASAARVNNSNQTPLCLHCQRRQASREVAQILITAYSNAIKIVDGRGWTPIHYAAEMGNHGLVQLLLDECPEAAGVRTTTHLETPLHLLCRKNNVDETHIPSIERLIQASPMALIARDSFNSTPLHSVARTGRSSRRVVECLLSVDGANVASVRDCNNYLPIHHACEVGAATDVIECLLEAYPEGATAVTKKNETALSLACTCNKSTETVALLIRANPRALTARNNYGFVPLHSCLGSVQPRMGIVEEILAACPESVAMKSNGGETAIHIASGNPGSCVGVIELLTSQYEKNTGKNAREAMKENPFMTNKVGSTPLHHACFRSSPFEHIESLAMSNPEWVKSTNNAGYTPLQIMAKNGNLNDRVITTFSRIGGPGIFSFVDLMGNTPLHSAIRQETDIKALRCLIRAYPDALRMKTTYGDTPLHLACFRRVHPEVVREIAVCSRDHLLTPNTAGQTPIGIAMDEFGTICRAACSCSDKTEYQPAQNRAFEVLATLVKILHYGSSQLDDRDRAGSLVRACVALHRRDARLDPAFIRRALHLHGGEEARILDEAGNYPMHIEASIPIEKMALLDGSMDGPCSKKCHKRLSILRVLFEIFPEACQVQNHAREFPLGLMIQNGRLFDQTFAFVLQRFPQALHWSMGADSKLFPRVLSKVSSQCGVSTLFRLISSRPDIAKRHSNTANRCQIAANKTIRGIQNVSGVACHLLSAIAVLCYSLAPLRNGLIQIVDSHSAGLEQQASEHDEPLLELGRLFRELSEEDACEAGSAVDPSRFFASMAGHCNANELGDASRAFQVLLKEIRSIFLESMSDSEEQAEARQNMCLLYEHILGGSLKQDIVGRKPAKSSDLGAFGLANSDGDEALESSMLIRTKTKQLTLPCPFVIDGFGGSVSLNIQAALESKVVLGYDWDEAEDYQESLEQSENFMPLIEQSDKTSWTTTRQISFLSLPTFLPLHPRRFKYQDGCIKPSNTFLDVPLKLQLQCAGADYEYELVGGVVHVGQDEEEDEQIDGGHYVTLFRQGAPADPTDQWYLLDDEKVEVLSQQKALDIFAGRPSMDYTSMCGTMLVYSREKMDGSLAEKQGRLEQSLRAMSRDGKSILPPSGATNRQLTIRNSSGPEALVGKRLRIKWSKGKFYAGKITAYIEASGKHQVEYDDGEKREYKLHKKVVEWEDSL